MFLSSLSSLLLLFFQLFALTFVLVSGGTNEEGLAFLAANKEKEGVVELPSGLQYKILRSGSGSFHPIKSTPCLCHYTGKLIDGTKFDSSHDRGKPTTFSPNEVIAGWTEAMQLMVEGDKWELYIPSELGYGDRGSPPKIPGGAALIFEMELLELKGSPAMYVPKLKCVVASKEGCSEKEVAYINKVNSQWDKAKTKKELERVDSIIEDDDAARGMKAELLYWLWQRQFILKQIVEDEIGAAPTTAYEL